ncbi:MAG: LLM class flavin-dependent oxidoreductase [Nitrospinota bacterium]|nr:LLM class flavin-dependent oxidoreductase [Nitrospinota bacterium]
MIDRREETSLKFGLVYSVQSLTGDWRQICQDVIEQVVLAEELGFESVFISEHHLVDNGYFPSVMPFCAALAARTSRIKLGTAVVLLPLHNPFAVAEDSAVVDNLSKGRFILGLGVGYRQEEFDAFGVPLKQRGARFAEGVPLVRRLLSEENVTHEGRFWNLKDVTMTPRPVQKPCPPIWIAAKQEATIRRAARIGDEWFGDPVTPYKILKERMVAYRDELAKVGRPFEDLENPLFKEAFVGDTTDQAWEDSKDGTLYNYKEYLSWGHLQDDEGREVRDFNEAMETLRRRFIIGSPRHVINECERYSEELGIRHFIFRMQGPVTPHEKVIRSIRLMGEEVIPHFAGKT